MLIVTYLRGYLFNLLGFINGTKHFEKNPSGLVSLTELSSAEEVHKVAHAFKKTFYK